LNHRYAPGTSPEEAEARLAALCGDDGELRIDGNAPSGAVPEGNPLVDRLIAAGDLKVAPKQAWTPVAELSAAGVDAVNLGPGEPRYAHRRDERVAIAALEESHRILERFLCA